MLYVVSRTDDLSSVPATRELFRETPAEDRELIVVPTGHAQAMLYPDDALFADPPSGRTFDRRPGVPGREPPLTTAGRYDGPRARRTAQCGRVVNYFAERTMTGDMPTPIWEPLLMGLSTPPRPVVARADFTARIVTLRDGFQ